MQSNKWIEFVKKYAKENKLPYKTAMKEISNDPNKKGYINPDKPVKRKNETNIKDSVLSFINSIKLLIDKEKELSSNIELAKKRFINKSEQFKKEVKKYSPDIYNFIVSEEPKKDIKNILLKKLDNVKYNYLNEYNTVKDALSHGVPFSKLSNKKILQHYLNEYNIIKDKLYNDYRIEVDELTI